jgi:hypothetical protein
MVGMRFTFGIARPLKKCQTADSSGRAPREPGFEHISGLSTFRSVKRYMRQGPDSRIEQGVRRLKSASRFALLLLGVLCVGCSDARPEERAHATAVGKSPPVVELSSGPSNSPGTVANAARDRSRALVFHPRNVVDLAGHPVNPLGNKGDKAVVLIFVCTDCPVANRYAPDLERLYEAFRPHRVAFWLVYADPREEPVKIRHHLKDYGYTIAALRDPQHDLVRLCGATKMPEAVVLSPEGTQLYRGRIDDRFTDYGKARSAASREDLREAIDCVLRGRQVAVPMTPVVGCLIPDTPP